MTLPPLPKIPARTWINALVMLGAAVAAALAQYGITLRDVSAADTRTVAVALVVGLLIPGSPVGHVIDYLTSLFGGPPSPPPTVADINAIRQMLPPPQIPRRVGGRLPTAAFVALATLFAAAGGALLLPGCGASALRQHAQAAHAIHEAIEGAGVAIETYTTSELAGCARAPHRDACIDRVASAARPAAALRDAMIAPSDVYRAEVDAACGIDAAHPAVPDTCPDAGPSAMRRIEVAAQTVARDWPAFAAALVALGAPPALSAIVIPGGQ